jgi:hypothetical protein
MKKLALLIAVFMALIAHGLKGQNLIAVQNGANPTFYTKLDSAVLHAQDGDTIYVPGGYYNLNNDLDISKLIHIIGVGHNLDSTLATVHTRIINVGIHLHPGASGGSLIGVYLDGNMGIYNDVSNYLVQRCNISNVILNTNITSNNIFIENVIGGINLGYISSSVFYNNIISGHINDFGENLQFKNNIFLTGAGDYTFHNPKNSVFENNIILSSYLFYDPPNGYFNIFNNNLFTQMYTFPFIINGCTIIGSNNIVDQAQSSIFLYQSGNSFSYSHDYHLQPTCPGRNAGTNGTDIGIYGGSYPWKEGSLPANPHIQHKVISNFTNEDGNLNVNIKVAAQDR